MRKTWCYYLYDTAIRLVKFKLLLLFNEWKAHNFFPILIFSLVQSLSILLRVDSHNIFTPILVHWWYFQLAFKNLASKRNLVSYTNDNSYWSFKMIRQIEIKNERLLYWNMRTDWNWNGEKIYFSLDTPAQYKMKICQRVRNILS